MDNTKKIAGTIAQVFEEIADGLQSGHYGARMKVGLTLWGSEHGEAEMLRGAELAQAADDSIQVIAIGPRMDTSLTLVETADAKAAQEKMDEMLAGGALDAAVTMHYSFPIGVSTVGRVSTPGLGRQMLIASTTGTSDTERASAMLKNAIAGIAVARACGNAAPTVGILNLDGARQVERGLIKLSDGGYPVRFAQSARADGGAVMRGNDLLQGVPDIMVADSLTGNVLMKTMSAFTTGGNYEATGDGYGPGVGEGYDRIVGIISRASGAPVVAGALRFLGRCARGGLTRLVDEEFAAARKAGLEGVLRDMAPAPQAAEEAVQAPPQKVTTDEITGVEILSLEDAVRVLWKKGIYASSGMGCTGPVIMVAGEDEAAAKQALKETGYL